MKRLFALLAMLVLCTPSFAEDPRLKTWLRWGKTGLEKGEAKAYVARNLFDPGAAQFRNMFRPDMLHWCGEVNGKNKFGGYVGFRRFSVMAAPPEPLVFIEEPDAEGDFFAEHKCTKP